MIWIAKIVPFRESSIFAPHRTPFNYAGHYTTSGHKNTVISVDFRTPAGRVFYFGGARNLLPLAYERPSPNIRTKGSKTGKNREFLQKTVFFGNFTQLRLEHARRISVFLPCPAQKFPTKTTGNFSEHNRELSANNRELIHYFFGKSTRPLGVFKIVSIQDFA